MTDDAIAQITGLSLFFLMLVSLVLSALAVDGAANVYARMSSGNEQQVSDAAVSSQSAHTENSPAVSRPDFSKTSPQNGQGQD